MYAKFWEIKCSGKPQFFRYQPPAPSDRNCFALLFFDFVIEIKSHFYLFKIATQRVSLWHFHVYIYIYIYIYIL
jgi:hypothetical protein